MQSVVKEIESQFKKSAIAQVRSGDTVRVHQKIREGSKERVQIFEGLVIRTGRMNSHTATITVRRIASGIGVEKTYLLHSPLILKVEVVKRSKVRRNYLSYMRARTGKAARLAAIDFDRDKVNINDDKQAKAAEEKLQEKKAAEHHQAEAKKAKQEAEADKKLKEVLESREK